MPQKLCQTCRKDLIVAVDFKRKAIDSDLQWRAMVEDVKPDSFLEVKEEAEAVFIKVEPVDIHNFSETVSDNDEPEITVNLDLPSMNESSDSESDSDDEKLKNYIANRGEKRERSVMYQPKHSCPNCGLTFKAEEGLENHRTLHQCYKPLTCSICKVGVTTKRGLKRHYTCLAHCTNLGVPLPENIGKEPKTEKEKKKPRVTKESLAIECKTDTPPYVEYKCPICFAAYSSRKNVRRHLEVHSNQKFACNICTREYTRSDKLRQHLKTHEPNAVKVECDLCGKKYFTKDILIKHMRVHMNEPRAICPYCGRNFTSPSNMKQHVLRHTNTKNFKCGWCDKAFISKGELKGHEITHTGERRVKFSTFIVFFFSLLVF